MQLSKKDLFFIISFIDKEDIITLLIEIITLIAYYAPDKSNKPN